MDYPKEVQEKLAHLRSYVPFVERMISKLQVRSQMVGASHGQLERLHGLHGFLTNPIPRVPRMEMLEKMEAVIRSMQDKVHRAQGKSAGSSPVAGNTRFPQEAGHPRTGSSSSDPRTSTKQSFGSSRSFSNVGQVNSPQRTHQHSPVARSGSADWQNKKDSGGKGEKRREGQSERPRERGSEPVREGSFDRNRRESDRGDPRHGERNRDRGSDRSREREYERSRSREYEHRREMDSHRSREMERGSDRDGRLRISSEKEYERRQGSSKDREYERDRNREFGRVSSSQERSEYGKEREYRRRSQDCSGGDKDRRQIEGRSIGEQEKTQSEGKVSSRWSSLLDLPMPPPTISQDTPHSSDSKNTRPMNDEKFQNSREKLQRLFGIQGESSGNKEREGKPTAPKSRGWRDEVRARKDSFLSQRYTQSSGDIDERVDIHPQRHKLPPPREPPWEASHRNTSMAFPKTKTPEPRDHSEQWKSGTENKNTESNPAKGEHFGSARDTPLSPDQSPVRQFDSLDTPMSPDAEASFSPVVPSEECTPVKTIPLENVQQKGVDLEAIKKALAQIRANEKKSEGSQGPSYRYEDFVGPASSSKPDEDEPYDPEEVWNNQTHRASVADKSGHPIISNSGDTDLRSVPKDLTSLPQNYKGKVQPGKVGFSGSVTFAKEETHSPGSSRSALPPNKSPQRQTSVDSPRTSVPSGHPDHPVTPGSGWFQSGSASVPRPNSSSDTDMRVHPSRGTLPRHIASPQESSSPISQPSPFQSPCPAHPPPASVIAQRSTNRPPEDLPDKDARNYMGSRFDSVRSRIAHTSSELIKPGQQGVAATQMEKYKIKKQAVSEIKSASSSSSKLDMGNKSKDSVSVLDLLLPEANETKAEENTSNRDPHQLSQLPRDPRLKPPDVPESDTLSGTVHARDPRLPVSAGPSRDPRHQTNRDPRKDGGKFPAGLHREDLPRHFGTPGSINRDPRQDLGKVTHGTTPVRDPRHERLPLRGVRDIRQETGGFPSMAGSQPRDPRMVSRGDRPTSVWPQHQQPPVPATSYGMQAPPVIADNLPSQSASGPLIGQTFTCLMMRGLPSFTNSNHIYIFFQEYILRDISIELDNHLKCKGTAYVHFPSHQSAREALELMNGHFLQGSPITLRICTVGILRQAKNAYENLNREREARLGIPERPRGNGNPFFKPRSKEPRCKSPVPVPKSSTGMSEKASDVPESEGNKNQGPGEGSDVGSTGQYSDLCGIKVPPKSTTGFKIPKIRKDEPKQKDISKEEGTNKSQNQGKAGKSNAVKVSKDSSESEDEVQNIKAANTKTRKFKKIVILSDSESDNDEIKRSENKGKKKSIQTSAVSTKTENKNRKEASAAYDGGEKDDDGGDEDDEDEEEDDDDNDDDEGFMVIDETILTDNDESEVSSQMSEEPSDISSSSKDRKRVKIKTKKTSGKQKLRRKSGSYKGKKKLQTNSASGKKGRGKKNADKYLHDNSYKPDLSLNSSVGLKLTRHTQGELEELIPEEKKLKVLIPVPLKIVKTICEDEKFKKKGGRQKVAEKVVQPIDSPKTPVVTTLKEIPEPLPVEVVVKSDSQVKPVDNLILPVDGYWEYTARYGPLGEMFLPENTHLMVALKKEVSVGTPTSRKGKKRQILCSTSTNPSKKPRWDISSSLFRDQKSDTASTDRIEGIHGTSKEDTSESCSGVEKRSLPVSYKGNDSKRLCLEKQNAKSEGTSHYDLFDDDPDLMQITPTLLDVDETITSALPNASALASVLSPPHLSHAVTENVNHKEGTDGIWTSGKHPCGDEKLPFDVAKQSHSGDVIEDDIVLEEMISIAMKTADAEDKLGTENKDQQMSFADTGDVKVKDKLKESVSSCESNQSSVKNIEKGPEVNEDHKRNYSENKATNIKKDQEEQVESSTSDNAKHAEAVNTRSEVLKELCVQTKTDNSDNVLKTDSDCEIVSAEKTSENAKAVNEELSWKTKSSEEFFKIKSEEATQGETRKEEESLELSKKHESDAGTKLDKDSGSGTGTHEDTDDDVASVGRVSTSSFVDDASVVSSEGHDVKTPESQPPKRGRKGKNLAVLPPVECRRVTRGSVVEPLTAEHVEWDDGGIVDLFQCDQCDYFGRHIAHHLVNFHTDRELPCEFKKEDFPPVIKDYVGPPQEGIKEIVPLDLSWIPNAMNFDENITCKECDYCSRNRFDLIYHYIEHFPKAGVCSVYHCRLCNYMSEKKENFYNHVSSHTGEYRFRCELCGHKTYKRELLESHHKESHLTQHENFSEAPMIQEDDWLYIYVCKICMFVRISLQEAENHVQQKHGGKADIHKANMRRPIVLHSELRKSGNESDSTPLSRPKYKKKCKKKKGKKLPDLDVFLGEEEEHGDEIEEEAKQLVDRISFNIHTSMSVQEANKRMSLLNSISKKLDEETEEESMEYDPKVESQAGEESSVVVLSQASAVESKPSTVSEKTSKDKGSEEKTKNDTSKDSDKEEKTKDETSVISGGKIINDNARRLKETDSISLESDTESTISAVEPESLEDEVVISGKGSLQDTIKRLSEKLDLSAKEQKTAHQEEEANRTKEQKEKQPVGQCTNSVSAHDNDSDSDTLVICEDADSDKEGETSTDLPQSEESSKQPANIVEPSKISLQDSIQSILREASTKGQSGFPVPKLRILPAHRLIDPQFSPKVQNPKDQSQQQQQQQQQQQPSQSPMKLVQKSGIINMFKCCVGGCNYSSRNNVDLIQHIIRHHGPYKCIASGCRFVTKSKELYEMHHQTLHSKLNFMVCAFHCRKVFKDFKEYIDHLTECHSKQFQDEDQSEEESESPGFLKIESVSTLDPAAASQMFGDEYASISSSSTQGQSSTKSAISNYQKIAPKPPVSSVPVSSGTSLITTAISPGSSERIITAMSPLHIKLSPSHSLFGVIPISTIPPETTAVVPYSSTSSAKSQQSEEATTISSSTLEKGGQPACVTIDEEESQEQKTSPLPPGIASLPKTPPTVPIQFMFQLYQTADVFKTLITKLAPEVFKCMYNGCIFAEDDPDTFTNHIREHGCEYRCCYCLVLMATPEYLVQHVIREHSHCQFQCRYCLYRAFTKIYMGVHLKNFHPNEEPRYIKVEIIQPNPPPNPPIDQFVRPYRCTYQDCQYRTVDAEAFKSHVNNHGPFVILSCDFCHKHLHVIPLIDHMREHQMNEYQCPYCLHGDAEKERLLSHLLNCHSGRPGKVLLRKQITSTINSTAAPCTDISSSQPEPPLPPPVAMTQSDSNSEVTNNEASETVGRSKEEEAKSIPQSSVKELQKVRKRSSRSSSSEADGAKGNEDGSISNLNTTGDESFLQAAEKTGLSGHALYHCGNDGCEYSSLSQIQLREHLQVCDLAQDSTVLRCYHCGKQCRHLSTLLDHLRVHGPKRYWCGVTGCDYRATMVHYFKNHMKQIHRCSGFKQLLKDSKNKDPENQEYVVYPKDAIPAAREGHRKRKNEYSIEDIHRIPRAHVSYQELKCYHCTFVSKVRLNLIKHIKLHEKYPDGIPQRLNIASGSSCSIPYKQPINPVPCLERKELMFDKMMNLAGSSFETKKKKEDSDLRAKNPIPPDEYQRLPKHVPEERLYTCGIEGCNYLSCDDMMLKYHIRTLHADATTFPCPHCINLSITVEKMSSHFKLHGERLYRCGWCPYISSRRNVVERHMKEKHNTKKAFDYVIREPEDLESAAKKSEEKPPEESVGNIPQPVLQDAQWQCGLCKFNSVTQQEMLNHTSLKHSIRSQFKCGYCSVRSSVRSSFDAHFAAKHPTQQFRVLCMYYRLDSEDIEPLNHGDAQHMHEPLWKRNDPERIRHIRGILIDDDPETKKNLFKQMGTGKPDKGEFVCPKCGSFRTSCVSTFRSHLCREASYDRYQCVECGLNNSLLPSLQRHYTKMHHAPFTSECYLELPVEEEKEGWVEQVINHQKNLIKKWQEKGDTDPSFESPSQTGQYQISLGKSAVSSRRSSNASSHSLSSETTQEQGGIVLHDSGSERGRFICDTCGSECRSAAGLKSHTTAMHQARFKCHYCPFASNSEDAVKQHSIAKHPKLQSEVLDVSQRIKVQRGDSVSDENKTQEKSRENQKQESIASPAVESSLTTTLESSALNLQCFEDVNEETCEGEVALEVDPLEDSQSSVVKTYSCKFCPFTTTTPSGLNHHKRTKHKETRLFMCMYCKGRFNSHVDALRHHKWKHLLQKPNIVHTLYSKAEEGHMKEQTDFTEGSEVILPSKGRSGAKLVLDTKPGKSKAKKSFTKSSVIPSELSKNVQISTPGNAGSEATYTCCHCNQQSTKFGMEEHMKKQHRDLPYQVRREEKDRVFTEVHIYKCIHCVIESISLAQAMDHWIQNHPLLDFKFDLVLRHSGEVSNQVVTSTTVDKDLSQEATDGESNVCTSDIDAEEDAGVTSSIASCSDITSSSESSKVVQSRQRESLKDTSTRRSLDTEEEEIMEVSELIAKESEGQPDAGETEDMIYKCGLCKKSSDKLQELKAHVNKIHPERDVKIKKLPRGVFEQLYRAEYKCGYCNEKGRHKPITRHHKSAHPGLPMKVSRLPQPPRENVYFRCDVCGHVVKNLQSVRHHIRRHHPDSNEFTFSKLTLGSPMRPPVKQPYKCNYCGDVGETLEEMHTHHAFLHSHLECSITNLMDEALSSLHSPSTSHSVAETRISSSVASSVSNKNSPSVSSGLSEVSKLTESVPEETLPSRITVDDGPRVSVCKNTARKSMPSFPKRAVAMKSTSKPQMIAESYENAEPSVYQVTQPPLELENVYAYVNLGTDVPMRLTVQQLGKLINLEPQVVVTDVLNKKEN